MVEAALAQGAASCGAANWSEAAQQILARRGDWRLARALLMSYDLTVETVTLADAERAAEMWEPGSGLSLADRLCLALGERRGEEILTADRAWSDRPHVRLIR